MIDCFRTMEDQFQLDLTRQFCVRLVLFAGSW
jgi:hypothetical protein